MKNSKTYSILSMLVAFAGLTGCSTTENAEEGADTDGAADVTSDSGGEATAESKGALLGFYASAWTSPGFIPEHYTKVAPATTLLNDSLYLAHRNIATNQLYWSTFTDNKWSARFPITGHYSNVGPAMASLGNNVYMVHTDLSNQLQWSMYDGYQWGAPAAIADQSSYVSPAVVAYGNKLHMVYPHSLTNELLWSTWNDGVWGAPVSTGFYSPVTPALAVYNDRIQMLYRNTFSSRLRLATYDGSVWAPAAFPFNAFAFGTPSLGVNGNSLHAMYMGLGHQIAWQAFNGTNWVNEGTLYNSGACGVGAAVVPVLSKCGDSFCMVQPCGLQSELAYSTCTTCGL